ncbi:unnamed protein product [Pylaiella littoralis]
MHVQALVSFPFWRGKIIYWCNIKCLYRGLLHFAARGVGGYIYICLRQPVFSNFVFLLAVVG